MLGHADATFIEIWIFSFDNLELVLKEYAFKTVIFLFLNVHSYLIEEEGMKVYFKICLLSSFLLIWIIAF